MVKLIPDIATYHILTNIINNGRAFPSQIPSQIPNQIPSQMLTNSQRRGSAIPVMKVTDFDITTRMVSGQSFPLLSPVSP